MCFAIILVVPWCTYWSILSKMECKFFPNKFTQDYNEQEVIEKCFKDGYDCQQQYQFEKCEMKTASILIQFV